MKPILLATIAFAFSFKAEAAKDDLVCYSKADKAVEKYFDDYSDQRREDLIRDSENGDIDEADLPSDFQLGDSYKDRGKEHFYYQWNELQECLCGVTVIGTVSKDGKSCKTAKVDENSSGCDCG